MHDDLARHDDLGRSHDDLGRRRLVGLYHFEEQIVFIPAAAVARAFMILLLARHRDADLAVLWQEAPPDEVVVAPAEVVVAGEVVVQPE